MDRPRIDKYTEIVIGGGFFGCCIALFLRKSGIPVVVLEMGDDLLQRASYANQARVHNGYHYPRSILTAFRSRLNFPRFISDYSECIFSDFDKYYAIGRNFSKVTASQYHLFFQRIGSNIRPVTDKRITSLFNHNLIEEVFSVREYAFDAVKLRSRLWRDLIEAGVDVQLQTEVVSIQPNNDGKITVVCNSTNEVGESVVFQANRVYNCTYAHINKILGDSHLPLIPLKHELTEMALIEMPDALKDLGVTVMCGPFFSFIPFPPKPGVHTLSHVRYTPHRSWMERQGNQYIDTYRHLESAHLKSNYAHMIKDVQRYIPVIQKCRYVDSIWEIKTLLPQSEIDDSRPILLKRDHGLKNLTCIMGGKIDNIYDIYDELEDERRQILKENN